MSTVHGSVGSHSSVGLSTNSDDNDTSDATSASDKKQEFCSEPPFAGDVSPEDVLQLQRITDGNVRIIQWSA